MKVTVIICTRNRARLLEDTLRRLVDMEIPRQVWWELLVVDNGSTDRTAEIIRSFSSMLPIRYIFESTPGLSNARNRGVLEAKGDYICWTDDDVILNNSWLTAYVQAFTKHPNAAFFGGSVEPVLEGDVPAWFSANLPLLETLVAGRTFSPGHLPAEAASDYLPFGANFAIRTVDQIRHPYDPDLGVAPNQRRVGEETAVLLALLAEGRGGVWVEGASVKHRISAERQSLSYIRDYQRSVGETWAYLSNKPDPNFMGPSMRRDGPQFFHVPAWVWRKVLTHAIKYYYHKMRHNSRRWLSDWQQYAFYRGAIEFRIRDRS